MIAKKDAYICADESVYDESKRVCLLTHVYTLERLTHHKHFT